jgi:hypothetical protein
MGGVSGGKGGPAAPDFNAAAQQQAASGHNNQTNAFGARSQWTQGPNGQWTQNATLGGDLGQGVQNLEQGIANQDPSAVGHARDQSITGAYNQAASRLDPQWRQAEEAQRSQLLNQGLDPGSQASGQAMGDFNRNRNDAYSSAMNNAIMQGNAGTQSELASQMAPYQQLGALHGLTQQSQGPGETQFLPAAMAQYQGALQGYGTQQAGKNSLLSGLGGLGGMALGGPPGAMAGGALGGIL